MHFVANPNRSSICHGPSRARGLPGLCALALALASALAGPQAAHAGLLDALFGTSTTASDAPKAAPGQRLWPIGEFSRIELVPREAGAAPNEQPVTVSPELLRQQLLLVQTAGRGSPQAVFGADELAALVGPLAQALGRAGPGDDVLLLSSSRREAGILSAPTAVTARLFVQGGALQFIAHDTRYDFYDLFRGTNQAPHFTFGSRSAAGAAVLQGAGVTSRRGDWVSIPLLAAAAAPQAAPAMVPLAAPAVVPVSTPAATPAAAAPMAPGAAPAAIPAPVAAAAPPAARMPLDAAGAVDIERRLETLKRLRDKGLITEDEYRQKRQEILQLL